MSEHKVGEHNYTMGRLNARQQLHIVRRIAPVFAGSDNGRRVAPAADKW